MKQFLKNILTDTFGLKFTKMAKTDHLQNTQPLEQKIFNTTTLNVKCKTVIECKYDEKFAEKMYWLDTNTSKLVSVRTISDSTVVVEFEDDSDALIFRIKFL